MSTYTVRVGSTHSRHCYLELEPAHFNLLTPCHWHYEHHTPYSYPPFLLSNGSLLYPCLPTHRAHAHSFVLYAWGSILLSHMVGVGSYASYCRMSSRTSL